MDLISQYSSMEQEAIHESLSLTGELWAADGFSVNPAGSIMVPQSPHTQ